MHPIRCLQAALYVRVAGLLDTIQGDARQVLLITLRELQHALADTQHACTENAALRRRLYTTDAEREAAEFELHLWREGAQVSVAALEGKEGVLKQLAEADAQLERSNPLAARALLQTAMATLEDKVLSGLR